jgi:ferredoxin
MIKAQVKPLEEIKEMVAPYRRVLTVGCGGCVSVCLAGGQKEAQSLNTKLESVCRLAGSPVELDDFTVERQCEQQFLAELDSRVGDYDAVISMACGAGVQFLAERFPAVPVFPGVNSVFVGVNKDIGWYEERCKTCGDCVLGQTGGICPIAMCAKSLFNGPCGGPQDGHCEVDKEIPCAWINIYERLQAQGRLDNILNVHPAREWEDQLQGRLLLDEYRDRYVQEPEEKK